MKGIRYFDKLQIFFLAFGMASFAICNGVSVYMNAYLAANYTAEQIANQEYVIPQNLSYAYTFFLLTAIFGITWFIVRTITFKSRRKQALES